MRLERRREEWFEELMTQTRSRASAPKDGGEGSGEESEPAPAAPRMPFLQRNVRDVTVELEELVEHNGLEMQFGEDKIAFVKFTEDVMYRVGFVSLPCAKPCHCLLFYLLTARPKLRSPDAWHHDLHHLHTCECVRNIFTD
jgi:hypothetical protein